MEGKAYTSRSNAKRAALKEYPEGNYEIVPVGDGFAFRGLEIEITEDGEEHVAPEVIDARYEAAAPVTDPQAMYALPPGDYTVGGEAAEKLLQDSIRGANVFGGLFGSDAEVAARVMAASHSGGGRSHKLDDNEGGCPLCGADASSVTYSETNQVDNDYRRDCHECGRRFNVKTGLEIKYGYTKTDVARGHKIEKNRDKQNGITRPSTGTQCRAVWDVCDSIEAAGGKPDAKQMRKINDEKGWNMNNTLIEFYQWRRFMGYSKKRGG